MVFPIVTIEILIDNQSWITMHDPEKKHLQKSSHILFYEIITTRLE